MKVIKRGSTSDYDKFVMVAGNRVYREAHAVELSEDIKQHNMMDACPVICINAGKSLGVIDGQHRVGACRILGIPVQYVVVDNATSEDISCLNRNQKGWRSVDYLYHFCSLGNKEYLKLGDFIEKTGLPVTLAANMVAGKTHEGGNDIGFKNGTYTARGLVFAETIFGILEKMRMAGCSFTRDRSLVKAVYNIAKHVEQFDVDRLVRRMRYTPLEKRSSWMDYAKQIDDMYNYRARKDNLVHIMSVLRDSGCMSD